PHPTPPLFPYTTLFRSYDDNIVAIWSTGAAGDQNPIYFQQTYDLRDIRIRDYAKRGINISNAMPPGGEGLDRRNLRVAKLMNQRSEEHMSELQSRVDLV